MARFSIIRYCYIVYVLFANAEKQTFEERISIIRIGFGFTDTVLSWWRLFAGVIQSPTSKQPRQCHVQGENVARLLLGDLETK